MESNEKRSRQSGHGRAVSVLKVKHSFPEIFHLRHGKISPGEEPGPPMTTSWRNWRKEIDRYLMFYARSTAKGLFQGETKCISSTSKHSDSLLNTYSTVEDWRNLGKMNLNEPGRQKLWRKDKYVNNNK